MNLYKVIVHLIIFFTIHSSYAAEYKSKCEEKASDFKALYHDKDARELYDLCLPLAEKGDPEAQYQIGALHTYNRGGIAQDEKEAFKWMKLSADQGNAKAYVYMGSSYEHGNVVKKDINKAIYWYNKAADKGEVAGLSLLGRIYREGRDGVPINGPEAVRIYTRYAEYGYINPVEALIEIYSEGLPGFPPDKEKAQYWKDRLNKMKQSKKK